MGVKRTGLWVAVVATATLLAGCATSVPAGPTDADLEAYTARSLDAAWAQVASTVERPSVARERYITNAQYVPVMGACMSKPGSTDAAVAWFICQSKYPVTPAEYRVLSDAQVDYLYAYLKRWTIPCLQLHGYAVELIPATRFAQYGGLWNPLYTSDVAADISDEQYAALDAECGVDVVDEFPR
jgi:hypothetical protein